MLRTLHLGNTGIETSALGFGCADLFREPSGAGRQRLLDAALDAGIWHFDVAPMYGLGLVERELGRFARGRRDRILIATKFGIVPTPGARALAYVQGPIWRLFSVARPLSERARPTGRDPRAGAVGAALYRSGDFSATAARASLERSMRELRTDHVDVLFLHDPAPGEVRSDDVRGYLESARAAGHIRAWGVAGEAESSVAVARGLAPPVPVLQIRGDVFDRSLRRLPSGTARSTVLFGVIGRALPRILAHACSDEHVRHRWSNAVGVDCCRADEIASLLLRDALRENSTGPVLFSTLQAGQIYAAARAVDENVGLDAGLDAFRKLVEDELSTAEVRA